MIDENVTFSRIEFNDSEEFHAYYRAKYKDLIIDSLRKLLRYLHEARNLYPVELEALDNSYLEDLANAIMKLEKF